MGIDFRKMGSELPNDVIPLYLTRISTRLRQHHAPTFHAKAKTSLTNSHGAAIPLSDPRRVSTYVSRPRGPGFRRARDAPVDLEYRFRTQRSVGPIGYFVIPRRVKIRASPTTRERFRDRLSLRFRFSSTNASVLTYTYFNGPLFVA